jgi:glycosyltransferase involved in cell wall biosynthesis
MNILMMTNTYTPLLGGLERSIKTFAETFRRTGHRVLIVAPTFKNMPEREQGVIRVPSIQNFRGTDFSVRLPIPGILSKRLKRFRPDIVHAHHPFLMGDTALRVAIEHRIPLVFTHHTLFEQYTHYLPIRRRAAEKFLVTLATEYANLCDAVFAPSQSIAEVLRGHGVKTTIAIVPTGIPFRRYFRGSGRRFLRAHDIPAGSFVVGHVGRLAKEKNLSFMVRAVTRFLIQEPRARLVIVGTGPLERQIIQAFGRLRLSPRVRMTGPLHGQELVDAYRAMDVFAFASHSETQGLVLTEAMAAGVPVVAVDAPGVREVVEDHGNGRLLPEDDVREFAQALHEIARMAPAARRTMQEQALATAERFSTGACAARAIRHYAALRARRWHEPETRVWERVAKRIRGEAGLFKRTTKANLAMLKGFANR